MAVVCRWNSKTRMMRLIVSARPLSRRLPPKVVTRSFVFEDTLRGDPQEGELRTRSSCGPISVSIFRLGVKLWEKDQKSLRLQFDVVNSTNRL